MNFLDMTLLALGDAMDACAISMAMGTITKKPAYRHYLKVGLWFGGFQALMTVAGYFVAAQFADVVCSYDHWIALVLLAILGIKMLKDARSKEEMQIKEDYSFKTMLIMAIATSIDALAVGVSLAFIEVNIWTVTALIGIITLLLSMTGLKIGSIFGNRYKSSAEIIGGIVLIFMGVKIIFTHLCV